jgi:hypothetical protein
MNCSCKYSPLSFREGERTKVRGSSVPRISEINPHPTLSLAKGEAKDRSCKLRGRT